MAPDPFFSLAVRRSSVGTLVTVAGELDVATTPALARALADAEGEITVDLSATTFADPAVVHVLLAARDRCHSMRVLRRGDGAVARLLALTGTEALVGAV